MADLPADPDPGRAGDAIGGRAALRVGFTGHRSEALERLSAIAGVGTAAHEAAIAASIESVVACIARTLTALPAAPDATPLINVVCGPAFGVDRLALDVIDRRFRASEGTTASGVEWRIELVLPGPLTFVAEAAWPDFASRRPDESDDAGRTAYARDWQALLDRSDVVTILPARWRIAPDEPMPLPDLAGVAPFDRVDRPDPQLRLSYVDAAGFQLRQIDLLVAVWDGEPARGPGGVADIVAHAHGAGIPIVLIDAALPDRAPVMLRGLQYGPDRPNVVGWAPEPLKPALEAADCRDGALPEAIRSILAGAAATGADDAGLTLADIMGEPATPRGARRAYRWFIALFGARARGGSAAGEIARSSVAWQEWANTVGPTTPLGRDILGVLQPRYRAVSRLANAYASRYRSSFVIAFLLAALASSFAVFGEAFFQNRPHYRAALILCELVALFAIFAIVGNGRRRRYHAKYLAYRSLAESLHNLRFLCAFGEAPPRVSDRTGRWIDHFVEATVREIALSDQALEATYQRRFLHTLVTCEIDPQLRYHEANARAMGVLAHHIHTTGRVLFMIAVVALVAMLFLLAEDVLLPVLRHFVPAPPWLGVIAALFPVIGSALAAIRSMAEFDAREQRSRHMILALRALRDRAERGMRTQDHAETRHILQALAATLIEDVEAFRATFSRRELELPG